MTANGNGTHVHVNAPEDQKEYEQSKIAPHSREAEEAVLGSILINPDAFREVNHFLSSETFFILRNAWVWEAMTRLSERHEIVEYLTVIEELRTQGRLEDIGGAAYITYLTSNVGTSVYAETYARIVERAHIRRKMLEAAGEIAKLARDEDENVIESYAKATDKLNAVMPTRLLTVGMRSAAEAFSDFYDQVVEGEGLPSVKTGFADLETIMGGGFYDSDLYIVAARPGMGKTSLLLNFATNAEKAGKRVALYSLEMSMEQVIARFTSAETGINSQKFRAGLDQKEKELVIEFMPKIETWNMNIDDTPGLSLTALSSSLKRLKAMDMVDIAFVDYLQLMGASGINRIEVVGKVARGLKDLAREVGIPIVAAAQLNRAAEGRVDHRPIMSDLRESGEIENSADTIIFIYRDDMYNNASDRPNEADLIFGKNRHGPAHTAVLYFRKHLTQFTNLHRTYVNLKDV